VCDSKGNWGLRKEGEDGADRGRLGNVSDTAREGQRGRKGRREWYFGGRGEVSNQDRLVLNNREKKRELERGVESFNGPEWPHSKTMGGNPSRKERWCSAQRGPDNEKRTQNMGGT